MPGRRLAGIRHQGPYPRISEAFLRLFPQADALGLSIQTSVKPGVTSTTNVKKRDTRGGTGSLSRSMSARRMMLYPIGTAPISSRP